MYAARLADGPRFRPASLGAALAINGAMIAGLILAGPEILPDVPDSRIPVSFIPKPLDPEPPRPLPSASVQPRTPAARPSAAPSPAPLDPSIATQPLGEGPILTGGTGSGPIGETIGFDPPRPAPPLPFVGASFDPRYARDVEPAYPDALRDAGVEGAVRLRITIGSDGRVTAAEPLAGDPRLARIAVRHVLARWRFRPATRGGVPEGSQQVLTVRFRLDG